MGENSGVGMPASLYLNEFGSLLWSAFGGTAYQVGSSIAGEGKPWRDVDVRVILSDEDYAAWGFGDPARSHHNARWCAMVMAFTELGRKMTGLPIDFQIQQNTDANTNHHKPRSALGVVELRMARCPGCGHPQHEASRCPHPKEAIGQRCECICDDPSTPSTTAGKP